MAFYYNLESRQIFPYVRTSIKNNTVVNNPLCVSKECFSTTIRSLFDILKKKCIDYLNCTLIKSDY